MSREMHVLAIVGSLRTESYNRLLARHAQTLFDGRATFEILDYADVPLMNEDIEFPEPDAVGRVRSAVRTADALWIFTPEYNRGIPAALKNVLDWLSRSDGRGSTGAQLPLVGKPVALSGVGGRAATAAARKDLLALIGFLKAWPVGGEGEGFSFISASASTGPWEPSREDLARLGRQADDLLAFLQEHEGSNTAFDKDADA